MSPGKSESRPEFNELDAYITVSKTISFVHFFDKQITITNRPDKLN